MIPSLDSAVEAFLAPQERFEELRRTWAFRAGRKLCDLSYANPYDGPSPEAFAALRATLDSAEGLDLQYTPYGGATIPRRLVADRLEETHGLPFHWRDVVLTPGAMAALAVAFRAFGGPPGEGGEIVIPTPCWLDYPLYAAQLGLRPVLVPADPATLRLDLDALAGALSPRTRAVVVTQPGNPSGLLASRAELRELGRLLESHRQGPAPWLISDEAHRDVVMPGERFVSPATCYHRTVVVYSFGKHLALQGQRIGYVAVSPRAPDHQSLARHLERLCRAQGFCTPTALMQHALGRLLGLSAPVEAVAARRDRVVERLVAAGYDLVPSQATFFLYPRSPVPDDFAFVEALAREGVLVLPASLFHDRGRFRISLTGSEGMIDRALDVLVAAAEAA